MSELFNIVDFVKKNASVEKIALARMSLTLGEDVSKITVSTLSDTTKIQKFIKVAEVITNKKHC